MSCLDFKMTKEEIEALGFPYIDTDTKCTLHMWNWIPLKVDVREHPEYKLEDIEKDTDNLFLEVLKEDLQECKIEAIHSIEWSRLFQIGEEWDPRKLTALFNVRVLSKDIATEYDISHVRVA